MVIDPVSYRSKSGRQFEIRSVRPEDADNMMVVLQNLGRETINTLQYPGRVHSREALAEGYAERVKDPRAFIASAFDHETSKPVGFMVMRPVNAAHSWLTHRFHFGIGIEMKYWGDGVASALMRNGIEVARRLGARTIEGEVRWTNADAIRLYKKFGFEITGRTPRAACIDGVFYDVYAITLLLD